MPFIKDLAQDCIRLPNNLPAALRTYPIDEPVPPASPDGNADRTFGNILRSDMFVYVDGATPIPQHPQFSVEIEPPATNGANGSANWVGTPVANPSKPGYYFYDTAWTKNSKNIVTHPLYVNNANFEGVGRYNTGDGGFEKLGRVLTPGEFQNSFLFSGHKNDGYYGVSRGRSMLQWNGANVYPVDGVTYWHAMRWYWDVDEPTTTVGNLMCWQLFAYPYNGGLFPPLTVQLNTSTDKVRITHQYSTTSPSRQVSSTFPNGTTTLIETEYSAPYSGVLKRWVDLVVKVRKGWDLAASQSFAEIYLDNTLLHAISSTPIGFNPPAQNQGTGLQYPIDTMIAMGIYPTSSSLTPNTERRFYLKRGFACQNAGNYSLADLRGSLVAA